MQSLTDFHDANRRVIDACHVLIREGFDDVESYMVLVRIHMAPWFAQMRQVAEQLAHRGVVLTGPHGVGVNELLAQMRHTAHRQLGDAITAGNAEAAAKSIIFACGVEMALDGVDTGSN